MPWKKDQPLWPNTGYSISWKKLKIQSKKRTRFKKKLKGLSLWDFAWNLIRSKKCGRSKITWLKNRVNILSKTCLKILWVAFLDQLNPLNHSIIINSVKLSKMVKQWLIKGILLRLEPLFCRNLDMNLCQKNSLKKLVLRGKIMTVNKFVRSLI